MKITTILAVLLIAVFISCSQSADYQPKGLRKLSADQLVERARNQVLALDSISYKDSMGRLLSKDALAKLDRMQYTSDLYVDRAGTVREIVIRTATKKDLELRQRIENAFREGPTINLIEVDCSKLRELLQEVYEKDQANRTDPSTIDPKIDIANQQKVISIIEQCGFPSSEQAGISGIQAIFLVIQHASPTSMEKYFPQIQQSADRGDLGRSSVALMEDRILMNKGMKQKYGSQVFKKSDGPWQLHPIQDPEKVNERRALVGLGPIEEYLLSFNIVYKP